MKKLYKNIRLLLIIFALPLVLSCEKEVPPRALLTVVDEAGVPVNNAKVTVKVSFSENDPKYANTYIDPNELTRDVEQYTSSSGTVEFEFVNDAVFTALAEKEIIFEENTITYSGKATIILKSGEVFEKTIVIK